MPDMYHNFTDPKKYTEGKHTDSNDFLCKQTITRPQEYITIVGSAEPTNKDAFVQYMKRTGKAIVNIPHSSPYTPKTSEIFKIINKQVENYEAGDQGNEYRFINHGIAALRRYPEPNDKIIRTMIVFQLKYKEKDKILINKYAEMQNARVIYIDNVSELVEILNQRVRRCVKVKQIDIFSHGVPGSIEFQYSSKNEINGHFNKLSVDNIDKRIFDSNSVINSYACRTGIAATNNHFYTNDEARPEDSLAQYMADKLGITVMAFQTRVEYKETYEKDNNIPNAQWEIITQEREMNDRSGAGPIMPDGAYIMPDTNKTNASPTGALKHGIQKYLPKK